VKKWVSRDGRIHCERGFLRVSLAGEISKRECYFAQNFERQGLAMKNQTLQNRILLKRNFRTEFTNSKFRFLKAEILKMKMKKCYALQRLG